MSHIEWLVQKIAQQPHIYCSFPGYIYYCFAVCSSDSCLFKRNIFPHKRSTHKINLLWTPFRLCVRQLRARAFRLVPSSLARCLVGAPWLRSFRVATLFPPHHVPVVASCSAAHVQPRSASFICPIFVLIVPKVLCSPSSVLYFFAFFFSLYLYHYQPFISISPLYFPLSFSLTHPNLDNLKRLYLECSTGIFHLYSLDIFIYFLRGIILLFCSHRSYQECVYRCTYLDYPCSQFIQL